MAVLSISGSDARTLVSETYECLRSNTNLLKNEQRSANQTATNLCLYWRKSIKLAHFTIASVTVTTAIHKNNQQ